ncbi:DUF6482 family protein [Pseudoalteromonas sp. BDTF-M6]|uniref:DUF6482 family protein n=1 Tax=Pseudoalteromonas sp. BDTF-M6 TaxID=2796132 RepID=UPI001BB0731E|nr:DUF6482 family protein [Pseudoalteromonas sp. BDTF-M6]MBS3797033.1 hypothetical protein [Pseudoalteromonas sp. BDTF-M6]
MQANLLKAALADSHYRAIILSYADANHYLAGVIDTLGNYHMLVDQHDVTQSFNSLREAERALSALGATQALLKMQSAYEELGPNDGLEEHIADLEIRHLS